MKSAIVIFFLLSNSLTLLAGWNKVDKGYISTDTLIGNKRYIPEENAIVVESKYSIKKFDLNTGEITKTLFFDDTTHSQAIADNNLNNVYLLYDGFVDNGKQYVYNIIKFDSRDTIISGQMHVEQPGGTVDRNLSLIRDSLIFFTGTVNRNYYIFRSHTSFSKIIELDSNSSVKKIYDSDFYFDNYNLWNQRNSSIMVLGIRSHSAGNHGGNYEVKLKKILFDSLRIFNFDWHSTTLQDSYSVGATYSSYTSSNNGDMLYFDYLYYTGSSNADYKRITVNEVINLKSGESYKIDHKLGDFVRFTTDDKWLVATTEKGINPVEFKVYSLWGQLIFNDVLNIVTNGQFFCYTDSTFFFEAGDKIFQYNPFENNFTGVSAQSAQQDIQIFPNPADNFVTIDIPTEINPPIITIYTQDGKEIASLTNNAISSEFGKVKLDISEYSTGLYFVRIADGKNTITKKFIKYK